MNDQPYIVDYMSLIRPSSNRYVDHGRILQKLADMARELNVVIMCNDKPFSVRDGENVKFDSSLIVRVKPSVITFKRLRKMPLH